MEERKLSSKNSITKLISLISAVLVYATTLPLFQTPFGQNLAVVVHVWTWLLLIVGLVSMLIISLATLAAIWAFDDKDVSSPDTIKSLENSLNNMKTVKPTSFWSPLLTIGWIIALAAAGWTVALGTYVVMTALTWLSVYGFSSVIRDILEKIVENSKAANDQ